ncbi:hypothetical protein TPELB_10230 [Terrisporobacter petrolearius]|uniref:4Fe-4S ferredoxin-type domain-containing protein n=1 Tax=Terrisporobacter petrolearius TaxID=1460447 RepID=A0ABZ3FAA2_9FIRM
MLEITKKEMCCGCYGCINICPKQCISMEIDNEGFWYPDVDKSKCIGCNLCVNACPIINTPQNNVTKISAYACKNKDENIRINSSSGGVFTLLCEDVINNDGVVFGAAFDENFNVKHDYSTTLDGCDKFRGSKYVQSKINDTYRKVKEYLDKGKLVLFSGTPCQIAGLDAFLKNKYENLYLIDIACHGVPSPLVFKKYIKKIEHLNGSKIEAINFRDKSTGWNRYSFKIEFENSCLTENGYDNIYMKGFLKDVYLRPSCYSCLFKKPITSADLTLADYWGVKNKHAEFDDDRGVSLVLVNSKKGKFMLDAISNRMDVLETDLEFAINYNPCIVSPVKYNPNRKRFFGEFNKSDIEGIIVKYTRNSLKQRVKNKINKIISIIIASPGK